MASQPSPQLPVQDQTVLSDRPQLPAPIRTVQDLRQDAPNPVEGNYQAAVPATHGLHLAGVGSKAWQVATLVIPILLTAWLTHVSSRSEKNVKDQIDRQTQLQKQQMDQQKQVFAEQVQLSQDLYKRQFDTYDKLYAQLLILGSAIERRDPGNPSAGLNRRLADTLAELDSLRKTNRLHISYPVNKMMGDAWQKGARMETEDLDQVEAQMEKEMKELMDVEAKLRKESASKQSASSPQKN
jgi:hypothetical protein